MTAIGIDLGTTNTLAARIHEGRPVCFSVGPQGQSLLPSVVEVEGVPGRLASTKRRMGRDPLSTRAATAILSELKRRVEASGETVGPVVLTVPAYFDDAQRQATRDAAQAAGLEVLRLLNEPTAAALAYGLQEKRNGRFAVYDLGGGTFDLSILLVEDGLFQVLSTHGDTSLGGDDFDEVVRESFGGCGDARALREALSSREEAPWGERRVTRAELEALPALQALVARTLDHAQQALTDAGLAPSELDAVLLVGGMTRMPLIRREVARFFGCPVHTELDPDCVVAQGAAIQAARLTGAQAGAGDEHLLLDVTPLSLGIEMMGGVVERLIPRNSPIPTAVTQRFTTFQDGQTALVLHVVQGERELAADCRTLARFTLRGLPARPAGRVQVDVTYAIDVDGILRVSAQNVEEERGVTIEVVPGRELSEETVETALFDAIDHAESDLEERALREARTEAEGLVRETRRQMAENPELLEAHETEELGNVLARLEEAIRSAPVHSVLFYKEALASLSGPFLERVVNQAVQGALAGKSVSRFGLS